jgi:hypothetical protein
MTEQTIDPFANAEKRPALSFKNAAPGTAYTVLVVDTPNLVQSRDFDTQELAFWPDSNDPIMAAVINVEHDGEPKSVWAVKPSSLFAAIAEAQAKAGAKIVPGGSLTITYTHEVPNAKKPHLNPAKQYTVTYSAPDAFAKATPAPLTPANPVQDVVSAYPGASPALAERLLSELASQEKAAGIIGLTPEVRVTLGYPA